MSVLSILTLTALLGVAEASRPQVLAVFPIHDKSKASKPSEIDPLSDLLASEVVRRTAFKVIPRGEIEALLRTEKNKSFESCYDEGCQIELGRELAASKVLKTQLLKIGDRCVFTSTLYDLATAAADWAHTEKSGCNSAELLAAVENIAAALGAGSSAEANSQPLTEIAAASESSSANSSTQMALTFRSGVAVSPLAFFGEVSGSAAELSWFRLNFGAGLKLADLISFELQLAPLIPMASPEFDFLIVPAVRFDLGYVYAQAGGVIAVVDGTAGIEASAGVRIADLVYAGPVFDAFFEGVVYFGLEVGVEFDLEL